MSITEFASRQSALQSEMQKIAKESGYDPDIILPVYDGVVNIEAYLTTSPRVMWVLKEPYDDFDTEGNPCGGGWTIISDHRESTLAEMARHNTTMRNIAYASFSIQNGGIPYNDIPQISNDNPEVSDSLLKVAYVNVNKMPSHSTTNAAALFQKYETWKGILFKQIDLYTPNTMIFCGTATLQCFTRDLNIELSKPERTIVNGRSAVEIHHWQNKQIVWAPHPAVRIAPEEWVNSIVSAVCNKSYGC